MFVSSLTHSLNQSQLIVLIQYFPILDTIRVREPPAEEEILAYIRIRHIDTLVAVRTALAPIDDVSALSGAIDKFVGAADVAGVEVPMLKRREERISECLEIGWW